jgi:hypothetical protein
MASRVVASVSARAGYAAAEKPASYGIVQNRVTGGFDVITTRRAAVLIAANVHTGNGSRAPPEVGLRPIVLEPLRLEKKNVNRYPLLTESHQAV